MTVSTAKQSGWWHGHRPARCSLEAIEPMEDSYSPANDRVAERNHGTKLLDPGPDLFLTTDRDEWRRDLMKMRAGRVSFLAEWMNR